MKLFGYEIKLSKPQPEQRSSVQSTSGWLSDYYGAQTQSGINVTDRKALGLSAFWQGVRIISEAVASLPIGLFEVADNGNVAHLRSHRADRLISRRPSTLLTSYKFRETMQAIATVRGNAYAWIERDQVARPVALHVLNPHSVKPYISNGDLFYRVWDQTVLHHLDVIHIRGMNVLQTLYNDNDQMGLLGENPVYTAKESLSVGIAAQEYEGNTMGKGGHIDGVLKMPGKMTDPSERRQVEDSWTRRYNGVHGVTRTPLLTGGLEYQRIALTPQESMLMETRKFSVEEVARILNIPQHKLGHLDKASFNNIEQLSRDFYIQTLRPWTENWESELEMKLLTEREKQSGNFEFRFDFNDLLRADSATQADLVRSLFNYGIISINDGRKMFGLNVIDQEWANKSWVQLNMSPADQRPEPKQQQQTESKFSTNGIHKN